MTKRLFLLSPTAVFTARVNQSVFASPVSEIAYDNGDEIGTVLPDMTLTIGSAAGGSDLGRQRVRAGSVIDTTGTLKFGRSSIGTRDGELLPWDDSYITIWNDFRPWAKIPNILPDGTIYKDDDIEFDDQTDEIPPKANILPTAAAGDIDEDDEVFTVSFSGTGSGSLVGATITDYFWDVDDGTITVGTSADDEITATFPAGFRWVSLTVTDSNDKTHTMRVPVYARDPANDTTIKAWQIERQTIGVQGQEISLKILESIPEGTYPDGTLVMIWEDDLTVFGTTDKLKFYGWHHTDPAKIDGERTAVLSEVTLDCLDIAGKLKTLPGFPISVEGISPPTTWLEMNSPNMDKYIDYLLRWHSTALELAYVTMSGTGNDYPFVILGSDASSLWEQAARRAQSLVPDYVLTCDSYGRIGMKPDPIIQAVADRTSTIQTTIDASEWKSISYTRQRSPRVHWLRSEAVLASATEVGALFCVAPDDTPGQGVSSRTQGEQISPGQFELNTAEGNRYARINAYESQFRIELATGDTLGIEPANMTWVSLTMSAAYAAQRGLSFTAERGLVHDITINYRYGRTGVTKTVSLTWERETDGPPAKTYIPPSIDPELPYDPPPDPGFEPDPTSGTGDGFAVVQVGDGNAYTASLGASSPTWVDLTGTITGTFYDFILDPYNPSTNAFCLTSNGVWYTDEMDQASPTWTQVLSASDVATATGRTNVFFYFKIEASINQEGYIGLLLTTDSNAHASHVGQNDRRLYYVYSGDSGATWNYTIVQDASATAAIIRPNSGLAIVPRIVNGALRIFVGAYRNESPEAYGIWRSDNGGSSFSRVATLTYPSSPTGPTCMVAPYEGNTAGGICWVSFVADASAVQIYKTTNGATFSTITLPSTTNANTETAVKRLGIEVYAGDSDQVSIWNSENRLFKSLNGGLSWSEITYSGYVPGTHGAVSGAGGFPYNGSRYYIVTANRYVFVSTDGGTSWTNKTGNLQSVIGANESSTTHRKGVIVPNWTE